MNKKITVIIVTYKTNLETLKNCLNSINKNINIVLIENSKKRKTMARAGRKLAEKDFAIEKIVDAHLKIYEDLHRSWSRT